MRSLSVTCLTAALSGGFACVFVNAPVQLSIAWLILAIVGAAIMPPPTIQPKGPSDAI
jgi:hypothetical protein